MSASQGSAKAMPRAVPRIQSPSPTHLPLDIKYKIRYTPPRIATEVKGLNMTSGVNEELERIGSQKDRLFEYINSYVPRLHFTHGKFDIGNEKDLKSLLYGIEQRFYTTPILDEKFIAKSIIPISNET